MIKVDGQSAIDNLQAWVAGISKTSVGVVQGMTGEILETLAYHSAQSSGDFASNWRVSVGAPDTTFIEGLADEGDHLMGDRQAVENTMNNNAGALDGYTLGQKIFISNSASHDGDDYAAKIESGNINFREGNEGMPMVRTQALIDFKYKHLTQSQIQQLLKNRL